MAIYTCQPKGKEHNHVEKEVDNERHNHFLLSVPIPLSIFFHREVTVVPIHKRKWKIHSFHHMDQFAVEVALGAELFRGKHLDQEYAQTMEEHDDEQRSKCVF